jgi:hypothetical protein
LNSSTYDRLVVFVCRAATGESLRSAVAIKNLDGVRLFVISEESIKNDEDFAGAVQVTNVHDADQLVQAARALTETHGALTHIVTAQETLLEPVAKAREALNVAGMSSETVRRALDKSILKATLRGAGIVTPPDQVVTGLGDAVRFLSEVGFPIMLKPLSGSGALATLLIRTAEELDQALELMRPSPERPVLAEAYLRGQELCIDTITIANEPRFYSICCYHPSILEALEHSERQWNCVMPRVIDDEIYRDFTEEGLAAVRALAVGNAMTHMEGFIDSEGRSLGFTDATLRPAGARIGPMLGFAYDIDPHRAWARAAVDGSFDGPWERKYAVGTILLRGPGSGLIERVDGIETVTRELTELLVDVRWPTAGAKKSDTYTGDGYVTVRHEKTGTVTDALEFIADTVRLSYSHSSSAQSELQRQERFRNYHKLNQPVWEVGGSQ